LRGYAFDSSLATKLEMAFVSEITYKVPWEVLEPGPIGEYIERYFAVIQAFVARTYDNPAQEWRRIDHDWLMAFGQLAHWISTATRTTRA
jgi:hypothetical protein